jgi:hypothetical protein
MGRWADVQRESTTMSLNLLSQMAEGKLGIVKMSYSDFKTLEQAVTAFDLTVIEGGRFLEADSIAPSLYLQQTLERELPWAIAVGTEIARREGLTHAILMEVRELTNRQIALFAGRDFNVDPSKGLSGYCDYLISRNPTQSIITAPVVVVAEAKKGDLDLGLGQCVAGMVGAWEFNAKRSRSISAIYGTITTGSLWKFLRLVETELTIDLSEYSIQAVDTVLGILMQMVNEDNKIG